MAKKNEPNTTIRRVTFRVNQDDSDTIATLCKNTTMNESEVIRFCMYVTREVLSSSSVNVHVKNTLLKAAINLLSPKLKKRVQDAVSMGERFDEPNTESMGWHKCINIFHGIVNIRTISEKKKSINRLG